MGMRVVVTLADETLIQRRKPDCDVIFVWFDKKPCMPIQSMESSLVIHSPDYHVVLGYVLFHHRLVVVVVNCNRTDAHKFAEIPICHKLCTVVSRGSQIWISTTSLICVDLLRH